MEYKKKFKPMLKTDDAKRNENINANINSILNNIVEHSQ